MASRDQAREMGRLLYALYGTMTNLDTIKVFPNGTLIRGLPEAEADGWAVYAFGSNRVIAPKSHLGSVARMANNSDPATCLVCDSGASNKSPIGQCLCTAKCDHYRCGAPRFVPPEVSWP